MAEETFWLVVVDGEGCGETRLCTGEAKLAEVVNELCEGEDWRTRPDIFNWREYIEDEDNWMALRDRSGEKRWRLATELGETGHLMIQQIDKQDMMEMV